MAAARTVAAIAMYSLVAADGVAAMPVKSSSSQHLDAPDAELQDKVSAVLTGFYEQRAPTTQGKKMPPGPGIKIQVPEKELQALIDQLSTSCEVQFSDILHGRGPALHTFGHPGTDASGAGCKALNGTLCAMEAEVSRQQDKQGRSMSSSTQVEGHGCLPSACMASNDLQVLAAFMQSKAKGAIPSPGVEVHLNVDCSVTGGSHVEVGKAHVQKTDAAAKAEHTAESGAKVTNQTAAEKPAVRGAAGKIKENAAVGPQGLFSVFIAIVAVALVQA